MIDGREAMEQHWPPRTELVGIIMKLAFSRRLLLLYGLVIFKFRFSTIFLRLLCSRWIFSNCNPTIRFPPYTSLALNMLNGGGGFGGGGGCSSSNTVFSSMAFSVT